MKRTWFKGLLTLAVATSFIFVFMTQVMAPENTPESVITTIVDKAVVAYVSIDINPSFEVSVLEDDTVSAIEQLNEDALSIDVSDLIGQDVSVVLEAIVARAAEAGFINTEDLLEDYVLVTTVLEDDTNSELDERLYLKLQTKIHESAMLNTLNVVQMKSDMVTKLEAEGANVPVGLYVINGQVAQEDGTTLSAREFFANTEYLNQLKSTYQITVNEISNEQLKFMIQGWIDELTLANMNMSTYQAALMAAGEDHEALLTLQNELSVLYSLQTKVQANSNDKAPIDQGNSESNTDTKQSENSNTNSSSNGGKAN